MEVVCVRSGYSENGDEFFVLCLYILPKLTRQALEPLDDLLSLISSDFPGSKLLVAGDFNFQTLTGKIYRCEHAQIKNLYIGVF